MSAHVAAANRRVANNYAPLAVTIRSGEGSRLTDVEGRDYLDFLAAYSAANFGHRHPALVAALEDQLGRVALTSRAFENDRLDEFADKLAALTGKDLVLPMNTGVEAVESALKVARKWGYQVRGVRPDEANIVVMSGNFHGRTTTVVSFSDDEVARAEFGPYTPGFTRVPYNDVASIEAALTENTVAILLEPVQGEAGVIVPDPGYLSEVRRVTRQHGVLMIADEVQSGLGRTGETFAVDHEQVEPDIFVLGKALGGGLLPVSAIVANRDVLGVLRPGEHGSTFGGNPLACAVGSAVVDLLCTGEFQERAARLGTVLRRELETLVGHGVTNVRTRGLWAGVDVEPAIASGREICEGLLERGVLAKDTHGSTIRLSPPIVVEEGEIVQAVEALRDTIEHCARRSRIDWRAV